MIKRSVGRAIPRIVEALGAHGVTSVKWFEAFHGEPVIWLVTPDDAAKERVAAAGCFRETVVALLSDAGVPEELAARALVTVESQESVDRDFEGNWFYAMK